MENIKKLAHKPTSSDWLLSKLNTNVVVYPQLKHVKKIDDILINNSFILLYPNTAGNVGHWVCVVKRNKTLSYFDSYGKLPDYFGYFNHYRSYPYLSKLLYESPYKLEYNEKNFQKDSYATCGRHCLVRIVFKNGSLEDYQKFMKQFKNDDELVTAISEII